MIKCIYYPRKRVLHKSTPVYNIQKYNFAFCSIIVNGINNIQKENMCTLAFARVMRTVMRWSSKYYSVSLWWQFFMLWMEILTTQIYIAIMVVDK